MNLPNEFAVDDHFYLPAGEFFRAVAPKALTYDDISLATHYSQVLPSHTDPSTTIWNIELATPFISADMDTVTDYKMAIEIASMWGIWILHSNFTPKEQLKALSRVKHHIHGIISDPITVNPKMKIGDLLELIEHKQYSFNTFPVVEDGKLVWLVSSELVKPRFKDKEVHEVMKPRSELLTIGEAELWENPIDSANTFFTEHIWINKLLIVDVWDNLKGLITVSDVDKIMGEQTSIIRPSRDEKHRLRAWASLYMFRDDSGELDIPRILRHVDDLVEKWVDVVAISTAHWFTKSVGEVVQVVREAHPHLTILAGNVTSGAWVKFLAEKWANAIKVGQWPGSICTTRQVAGVWIPQMTALYVCSEVAKTLGVQIIADGGITKSGDIVKALTLADGVMLWSLLAGCSEAPGEVIEIEGKLFKSYRWMGSMEAMSDGSAARYGHVVKWWKATAEWIVAMKEMTGSVRSVVWQLVWWLQSGMGYHGAFTLLDLQKNARYVEMSRAWQIESAPHDVIEIKRR